MKKLSLVIALLLCLVLAAGCGKGNGKNPGTNDGSSSETESSIDSGGIPQEGVMPDKFSFRGGTGKVGISCRNIVWRNDTSFATIIFDSDAYTYIRMGENKYNCEHNGDTSYAEIPVRLNENVSIYAETTKMSQAHEIEYTIFVYSAGAADEGKDPYALIKAQMDERAPLIPGIPEASPAATIESDRCTVFTYEYGINLLEMRMQEKDINEADIGVTTRATTVEEAQEKLYRKPIVKYLLVPEGAEQMLPAGIEKEAIIVSVPAANYYEGSGDIEMKDLLAQGCMLIMLDSTSLENDAEKFQSIASNAAYLGIPVIVDPQNDMIRSLLIG